MRVLVVEDDTAIRTALVQAFTEDGYAVDGTGDGEEGLWYAESNDYDLLVLDLNLPGLDGLELLRRVRDGERHPAVLIVSARDTVQDRVRGLDIGADDYLVKPFALPELLARARSLVRRRHGKPKPALAVGCLVVSSSAKAQATDATILWLAAGARGAPCSAPDACATALALACVGERCVDAGATRYPLHRPV